MAINQLYKIKPPIEVLNKLLEMIHLDLENDINLTFSLKGLKESNLESKFISINNLLQKYYIPCKKKIYLDNLNIKKFITILRQLLKLYNYKLYSINKYSNGYKYILYNITKIINDNIKKEINCIISFD